MVKARIYDMTGIETLVDIFAQVHNHRQTSNLKISKNT